MAHEGRFSVSLHDRAFLAKATGLVVQAHCAVFAAADAIPVSIIIIHNARVVEGTQPLVGLALLCQFPAQFLCLPGKHNHRRGCMLVPSPAKHLNAFPEIRLCCSLLFVPFLLQRLLLTFVFKLSAELLGLAAMPQSQPSSARTRACMARQSIAGKAINSLVRSMTYHGGYRLPCFLTSPCFAALAQALLPCHPSVLHPSSFGGARQRCAERNVVSCTASRRRGDSRLQTTGALGQA